MVTEVDTEVRSCSSKSLKTLTTEVLRKYGSSVVKSLKTLNGSLRKSYPPLKGGLEAAPISGLGAVPS